MALLAAGLLGVAGGACTRIVDAVTVSQCVPGSTDADCAPTPWPIAGHSANSDPWLVQHNSVITSMSPKLLVLNFDTGASMRATQDYAQSVISVLQAGSVYHGYAGGTATPFLNYQIDKIVDLTSVTPPVMSTSVQTIDLTALFNDPQFPPLYGYADAAQPSGYKSLCQLFEQGLINEVWIQDGGDGMITPRAPLYAERKQKYDNDGHAIDGTFESCLGGNSACVDISCGVTVRLAHLDPSMAGGPACDVEVRGWGIESMWSALPSMALDANAFLNQDFDTRFGVPFNGWPEICSGSGPSSVCVTYPGPTEASNPPGATTAFDIHPFLQGCGNSLFPPNAAWRGDFEDGTAVNSRCEHFGLHDAPGGTDTYEPYAATNSMIANYDQLYTGTSGCRGGWQVYWRQSMPGYQNHATSGDGSGTPLPNWWPILFY